MSIFAKSNSEKLVQDMKSVVADAEAILRATAGQAGGKVAEVHATMTARLADAKGRLLAVEEALVEKAKQAAKDTDQYVHENPWQTVAVVAGVVFLFGYLMSASRD